MFSDVLVGVDFRQGGRDAIALATLLCEREATLALVHAFPGALNPTDAVTPGLVHEERERAERRLEQERSEAGVKAELIVAEGYGPGRVLHEAAQQRGSDLIVLGSCHRGALGRTMLGDETRAAIDGAPCAVAVAPAGFALRSKQISSIGVAYDGSPESEAALEAARALAGPRGAEIRALDVVPLAASQYTALGVLLLDVISDRVEEADARMKAIAGVDGRATSGDPAEDLAVFAGEVDLLVVGSRGYGPLRRLVHGSTSARLARHARGPLLIVPRASAPSTDANGESTRSVVAA